MCLAHLTGWDMKCLATKRRNDPLEFKVPKVTQDLKDAQALAMFSNLEPAEVDYFRNNYPDFVPQKWWDYTPDTIRSEKRVPMDPKQWQLSQSRIQKAWKESFGGGVVALIDLLSLFFNPTSLFLFGQEEDDEPKPMFANTSQMGYGSLPVQRGVIFLFENPWRARFCAECNKRFVAAQPKNKFCSPECSQKTRNRQKLASWNKTGSKQRSLRIAKAKQIKKSRRSRTV